MPIRPESPIKLANRHCGHWIMNEEIFWSCWANIEPRAIIEPRQRAIFNLHSITPDNNSITNHCCHSPSLALTVNQRFSHGTQTFAWGWATGLIARAFLGFGREAKSYHHEKSATERKSLGRSARINAHSCFPARPAGVYESFSRKSQPAI